MQNNKPKDLLVFKYYCRLNIQPIHDLHVNVFDLVVYHVQCTKKTNFHFFVVVYIIVDVEKGLSKIFKTNYCLVKIEIKIFLLIFYYVCSWY